MERGNWGKINIQTRRRVKSCLIIYQGKEAYNIHKGEVQIVLTRHKG